MKGKKRILKLRRLQELPKVAAYRLWNRVFIEESGISRFSDNGAAEVITITHKYLVLRIMNCF